MSVTETAPESAVTTGVTVVAAAAMPLADVRALLEAVASATQAERAWPADDDTLGSLAYAAGAEAALLIVRRQPPAVAAARPDLEALLEAPIRDALRLDVMVRRADPNAFARADAALVALADRLSKAFCALVVDDLGSVYDPAEIAHLATEGLPRAYAFSYEWGAATRAAADEPLDIVPPPLPETSGREAPSEPSPDSATSERVVFSAIGPHLPLTQLARVTLALAGDPRTNPHRRIVTLFAPNIAAGEGLRLAALGVDLDVSVEAIGTSSLDAPEERPDYAIPVRGGGRDEIDVIARELSAADAVATIEAYASDALAASLDGTSPNSARPRVITIGTAQTPAAPGFPHQIASFGFDGAALDVYYLDLASADPLFATFVRARRDIALLLGGEAGAVVAIELYETPTASGEATGALAAADALSAALASAFVARSRAVASGAIGAVYGEAELRDLAREGRGRANSWSSRLATARSIAALG